MFVKNNKGPKNVLTQTIKRVKMFVTNEGGITLVGKQLIIELLKNTSKLNKEQKLRVLGITEGLLLKKFHNPKQNCNELTYKKTISKDIDIMQQEEK